MLAIFQSIIYRGPLCVKRISISDDPNPGDESPESLFFACVRDWASCYLSFCLSFVAQPFNRLKKNALPSFLIGQNLNSVVTRFTQLVPTCATRQAKAYPSLFVSIPFHVFSSSLFSFFFFAAAKCCCIGRQLQSAGRFVQHAPTSSAAAAATTGAGSTGSDPTSNIGIEQ